MPVALKNAPLRSTLVLRQGGAQAELCQRLAVLGLRPGTAFQLVQKTSGGGRMARIGQSRVAIGAELAGQLEVEVNQ
ncbi:MAG: ferrous iron transport protein A [Propionibacteriaceae bacterium]|nr:ferrous iron transport protein A [Propionibacteriaceae bacterium]